MQWLHGSHSDLTRLCKPLSQLTDLLLAHVKEAAAEVHARGEAGNAEEGHPGKSSFEAHDFGLGHLAGSCPHLADLHLEQLQHIFRVKLEMSLCSLRLQASQHHGQELVLAHLLDQLSLALVQRRGAIAVRQVAEVAVSLVAALAHCKVNARAAAQLGMARTARIALRLALLRRLIPLGNILRRYVADHWLFGGCIGLELHFLACEDGLQLLLERLHVLPVLHLRPRHSTARRTTTKEDTAS